MGWFDSAKDKAKDKAVGALTWPVKKISDKATQRYLRQKGKWVTGTCPHCDKPINAKRPGSVHQKCARALKQEVAKWESSMNINNTLYYECGVHNKRAYADFQHDQICDNKPKK